MFKYRAKRNSNCEWVYGSHVKEWNVFKNDYIHFIVKEDGEKCIIDPSTLGVCWGMKDKNGKDVYTGMFFKSEQLQCVKGQTSRSGTYWVPQLFKICFRKSAFVGINQDEEIQYAGHTFRGGSVVAIPEELEIIEEE